MTNTTTQRQQLAILAPIDSTAEQVFTEDACALITELTREFRPRLQQLLAARQQAQARFDAGALPDFLPETKNIRNSDWQVAAIPADLQDRRVEITGPVDRKMVINALNANVKVFMADFEDAQSPTWQGVVEGQLNLRDANLGTISYTDPNSGKHYALNDDPALLIARVRGLHLWEKHLEVDGEQVPGALMDFALYFIHNIAQRQKMGTGVYFYLPKLQSHQEAKWWDDVFRYTEQQFGVEVGTIRATVLIETLPAVFEMDEILYSLRDHIVALNCGRWDYIFSYIKTLKKHADRVLPDRQVVTMDKPFLNAYSRLLVKTCHKRGALAMGGMAALIPAKDPEQNKAILAKVTADKELEAKNGHDGTWVAHPGLASTAGAVLDHYLGDKPNQLHVLREQDAPVTAADLLQACDGERTETGMRTNIRVALQYMAAWISGKGCVPIYGLMEDAATAEISRASIWQWIQHGKSLSNGQLVTKALFASMLDEEAEVVKTEVGADVWANQNFERAKSLLLAITTADELVDFLTLPAYDLLP
ncbi:malate synthase A [Alkalimonas collagenimarina]|uniref:malate synthase n=1 Tax=Alkalimonas collagenimarina TaxID=400390 RepID=A0ABT9H3C9_9GAMM|nr:malate synthase A [Alkalimonas collagenimarina]MDP4537822.1 malate synthase A [Alkalimonas collagenimarina]